VTNTYKVTFVGDYTALTTTVTSNLAYEDLDGIENEAVDFVRFTTGVDVYAGRLATVDVVIDPA